jgi:hypothetical protein
LEPVVANQRREVARESNEERADAMVLSRHTRSVSDGVGPRGRGRWGEGTELLQLGNLLVESPAHLGPARKLVLATGARQLRLKPQHFRFCRRLLRHRVCDRRPEEFEVERP